jgi:hypothetical protein
MGLPEQSIAMIEHEVGGGLGGAKQRPRRSCGAAVDPDMRLRDEEPIGEPCATSPSGQCIAKYRGSSSFSVTVEGKRHVYDALFPTRRHCEPTSPEYFQHRFVFGQHFGNELLEAGGAGNFN